MVFNLNQDKYCIIFNNLDNFNSFSKGFGRSLLKLNLTFNGWHVEFICMRAFINIMFSASSTYFI